jgi:hypothetical protein
MKQKYQKTFIVKVGFDESLPAMPNQPAHISRTNGRHMVKAYTAKQACDWVLAQYAKYFSNVKVLSVERYKRGIYEVF